MDDFFKITACVIVSLVLYLALNKQGKDFGVLLSIAACCIILGAAASFLEPIITFIDKLETIGNFNLDVVQVMIKAVGIALISEITCLMCSDAGNASLGKALQILASVVILWLAIPLFTSLINLIEEILVAL